MSRLAIFMPTSSLVPSVSLVAFPAASSSIHNISTSDREVIGVVEVVEETTTTNSISQDQESSISPDRNLSSAEIDATLLPLTPSFENGPQPSYPNFSIQILFMYFIEKGCNAKIFLVFFYFIASALSTLLEGRKDCQPNMRIWLNVMAIYLFVKVFLTSSNLQLFGGESSSLRKAIEITDAFGIVAFSVGNLMLIRAVSCASEMPMSFYSSVIVIVLSNFMFLAPVIIKILLLCCPEPFSAFLRANILGPHEDARGLASRDRDLEGQSGSIMVPGSNFSWTVWLEMYDCAPRSYEYEHEDAKNNSNCEQSSEKETGSFRDKADSGNGSIFDFLIFWSIGAQSSSQQPSLISNNPVEEVGSFSASYESCPICLGDFNEESRQLRAVSSAQMWNNEDELERDGGELGIGVDALAPNNVISQIIVAPFPCSARHLFHFNCIQDWLITESSRRSQPTCPCCRERATFKDESTDIGGISIDINIS